MGSFWRDWLRSARLALFGAPGVWCRARLPLVSERRSAVRTPYANHPDRQWVRFDTIGELAFFLQNEKISQITIGFVLARRAFSETARGKTRNSSKLAPGLCPEGRGPLPRDQNIQPARWSGRFVRRTGPVPVVERLDSSGRPVEWRSTLIIEGTSTAVLPFSNAREERPETRCPTPPPALCPLSRERAGGRGGSKEPCKAPARRFLPLDESVLARLG